MIFDWKRTLATPLQSQIANRNPVGGPSDWLLAVDFQAGHDTVAKLPDLLLYNSALFKRHRLRVRSLLVLLHLILDLRFAICDFPLAGVIAQIKRRVDWEATPREVNRKSQIANRKSQAMSGP